MGIIKLQNHPLLGTASSPESRPLGSKLKYMISGAMKNMEITFRVPLVAVMIFLVAAIGISLAGILFLMPAMNWPPSIAIYFILISTVLAATGLSLLSGVLVVTESGIQQRYLCSVRTFLWPDIVEWRREKADGIDVLWLRDSRGKKHYLKGWLVFGGRSDLLVERLKQKVTLDGYQTNLLYIQRS